jgi:predicted DNA-binding mobile mystery protein A
LLTYSFTFFIKMLNYRLTYGGKHMKEAFKKLMRAQVQDILSNFSELAKRPTPPKGWIRTIREALGMSGSALAARLGCARPNIITIERNEQRKTISLGTLETVAQALNCRLVYCLVPIEPLDEILEKQARTIARKKIEIVNHSMSLEEQGLNAKQLQQEEDDLVQQLLQGDPKKLWGKT